MSSTYNHILDRAKEVEPRADGILSRTVCQDDRIKAVVFGFGQGQPIKNDLRSKAGKPTAFTKGQRYVSSERLVKARSTSDLL